MAHKTNSFERFWKELKRRKVVHVITVYAATAFVLLELVNMVARPLKLPEWTEAFVIVLLCIGFIIAVLLSWVYDITPAGVKKTKPVSAFKHTDHTATITSSGWKTATYVSGAIIIALVAFNFINRRNLNADISKLPKSIAVLPFINESPVDSNKYFINGIMEEILTNLQKIKDFRVLSRTSTDQYKGQDRPTIPEIAKRLGVSYIVEGSGQKYGNTFRLRVQLIKAKGKENHLWSKSFQQEIRNTTDLFNLQSQIAQAIATELKVVITPDEKQLIEKIPTANLTAYDFYQRGREEEGKFSYYDLTASSTIAAFYNLSTKQALERADKMYKIALKYDSTFAPAYTGLAGIYWSRNYYNEYFSGNFLDSVLILANKALSFDNKLPEAYYIRGMYYVERGINKQAIEDFDKTIKYNPNYWPAYFGKCNLYSIDADLVNAIKNGQKAESFYHGSDLSEILRNISSSFNMAGFFELANNYNIEAVKLESDSVKYYFSLSMYEDNIQKSIDFLQKAYSIDSTDIATIAYLGFNYSLLTGQLKETMKFCKKYLGISKALGMTIVNTVHRVGYFYWENGIRDSADYYFDKQIEICNDAIRLGRSYGISMAYYDLAGVYAFKGNKIKAYENLKIFNQKAHGSLMWVWYIKHDPLFDSLRNESEFQKIVNDLEAKYQAEHERVRKWLEETGQL